MTQYLNYIVWVIGIAILCVVQMSVVHTIPSIQALVTIPLICALLLGIVRRSTTAVIVAAVVGTILDLYSVLPFGVLLAAYLSAVAALLFMQKRVFKNFALHAVLINTLVALAVYHIIVATLTVLFKQMQIVPLQAFELPAYASTAILHTVIQVVLVAVCFYVAQILLRYAGRTTLHV